LRYRLRLKTNDGAEVHREFTGFFQPLYRTIEIAEIRTVRNKIQLVPLFPESLYKRQDGSEFSCNDFFVGAEICIGESVSQRDSGSRTFVITSVDHSQLIEFNEGAPLNMARDRQAIFLHIREVLQARNTDYKPFIQAIGRHFRIVDDTGDRKIDREELRKHMPIYGLPISDSDVDQLFDAMDADHDGRVSYDEFLLAVRGEMNETRKQCVLQAFKKLDYNQNGVVTVDDIATMYSTAYHPKVVTGDLSERDLMNKFIDQFDKKVKDRIITYDEFEDYYNAISASIDLDEHFVELLTRSWNLDHRNMSTQRIPSCH